jgi:two-component system response regulator GlrR
VNVRFVTATHRDLLSMVNRGEFREDLYFRLAVVPVRVPSLRERPEDIGPLLSQFSDGALTALPPPVLRALEAHPWRGNVRELRNFAARASALGPTEALALCARWADAPEAVTASFSQMSGFATARSSLGPPPDLEPSSVRSAHPPGFSQPFRAFREQWVIYGERAYLRALLERQPGNVAAAAKEAGLDRTYLYRLLRKHSL